MAALSKKDRHGLMLIATVLALVAVLLTFNWRLSDKPKPDQRNCLTPIERKTVIVVDRSDDTPTQTVREIVARVKRFALERAQENELISLFEISGASRTALNPVFSACLPQKDGNDLFENRRHIQRYFEEHFATPLDAALARPPALSESSPISEAIIDLSASEYLDAPSNRLLVFSDLIQNSDNTSLYGCTSARQAIAQFREHRAGAIERPKFENTTVELNIIPREGIGPATVACRDGFWAWFFGDNEGAESELDTKMLPGGAKVL
jgi:hypothetical protein